MLYVHMKLIQRHDKPGGMDKTKKKKYASKEKPNRLKIGI